MTNFFELLSLPESPVVDLALLDTNYKALAASTHPDQGGSEEAFQQLSSALKTLRTPSARLVHLLEIHQADYNKRGSVSNTLMNYFMSTGEIIQRADILIKKKRLASSALSKALLEPEVLEMQESISAQIDQLEQEQQACLDRLPAELELTAYETAARDLAFIEKWQAQLRERYASLF